MNKLEVGMYYRYKETIGKYIKPDLGKSYFTNQNKYGWHEIANGGRFSYKIIDLIELGDYINGSKVIKIEEYNNEKYIYVEEMEFCNALNDYENIYYKEDTINSILTKEQFESMEYEVSNE